MRWSFLSLILLFSAWACDSDEGKSDTDQGGLIPDSAGPPLDGGSADRATLPDAQLPRDSLPLEDQRPLPRDAEIPRDLEPSLDTTPPDPDAEMPLDVVSPDPDAEQPLDAAPPNPDAEQPLDAAPPDPDAEQRRDSTPDPDMAPGDGEPSISLARLYINLDQGSLGVLIEGQDQEEDVVALLLNLEDEAGEALGDGPFSFNPRRLEQEGGNFQARHSLLIEELGRIAGGWVRALDEMGHQSALRPLVLSEAQVAGELCDPLRAIDVCPEGFCTEEGCDDPPSNCLPGWAINNLDGSYDSYEGDLTGHPIYGAGSCGGGSGQDIHIFRAGESRYYSFSLRAMEPGGAPLLFARSHCSVSDPAAELSCSAISEDGGYFEDEILLELPLEAEETAFLFVDGQGWSGRYRFAVQPGTHPQILEAEAYLEEDALGIRGRIKDTDGDVEEIHLGLQKADGSFSEEVLSLTHDILQFEPLGGGLFQFELRGRVVGDYLGTERIRLSFRDASNHSTRTRTLVLQAPSSRLEPGTLCDYGFDGCRGGFCLRESEEAQYRCLENTAPLLQEASFHGAEEISKIRLLGIDDDPMALEWSPLDDEGMPIFDESGYIWRNVHFSEIHPEEGFFWAMAYLTPPEGTQSLRLRLLDSHWARSNEINQRLQLEEALEAGLGEICDYDRLYAACQDSMCVSGRCEDERGCLPSLEPLVQELEAEASGSVEGSTLGLEPQTRGSCGGGSGAAIFSFTAPLEGRYIFRTESEIRFCPNGDGCPEGSACLPGPSSARLSCAEEADCEAGSVCVFGSFGSRCALLSCGGIPDTVLYARSHCGAGDREAELGCDDDSGRGVLSALTLDLEAEEDLYLFVDGYSDWQGMFELHWAPPSPPSINRAEAYLHETRLGVYLRGEDLNHDVSELRYEILDAEGQAIPFLDGEILHSIEAAPSWNEDSFEFWNNDEYGVEALHVRARVLDREGLESPPEIIPIRETPTLSEGADCRIDRLAFQRCEGENFCLGEPPSCQEAETACPVDWPLLSIPRVDQTWRVSGNTETGVELERPPRCGASVEGLRAHVYTFIPPAAGEYYFHTEQSFDTVLSLRSHCNEVELELACNDDGPNAQGQEVDRQSGFQALLSENRPIYLFVSGYQGAVGDYTLVITPL